MQQLLRILVVDDCADTTDSLTMLLQLWGHETRAAREGRTALEVAAEFRPDVVLLDIGLPGMDGYEVARRLRQNGKVGRPMVIAVTGFGPDADHGRRYHAGFDHYLLKPVDPEVLRNLLMARESDLFDPPNPTAPLFAFVARS